MDLNTFPIEIYLKKVLFEDESEKDQLTMFVKK